MMPQARCWASGCSICFTYLRWETSVPIRLNEFAILIIGRQWRFAGRMVLACAAGGEGGNCRRDIIAELKANQRPAKMAED